MSHLFSSPLYRVGDLVDVLPVTRRGRPNSEGGRGFVKAQHHRSSSPTSVESFDVEYVVTRKLSKEVNPERMAPAMIDTLGRRRPASNDVPIQPSLLSPHLQASKRLLSTVTPPSPPKRAKSSSNLVTTSVLMDRSQNYTAGTDHPIIQYLKRQQQDSGYLRRNDAKAAGRPVPKQGSHMSSEEKTNLLLLRSAVAGVVEFKSNSVTSLLAHAFGVSNRQIQRLEKKAGTTDLLQRKPRSDAGSNLLTSSKLQDNWTSAYNCFKKSYRRQKQSDTLLESDITDDRLFDLWNGIMTDEDRKPYVEMSKSLKERLPFLIGDIQKALESTGGSCTWRQLETHLAGDGIPIVSREVIRRLVMGLPDSQYTSTKLLPALTTAHIIKRKLWCQQFWIFWDSARKFIRKRILLVHMDEKWFYGIVVRMVLIFPVGSVPLAYFIPTLSVLQPLHVSD